MPWVTIAIAVLMFIIGMIFVIQSIIRKRRAYSLTIAMFIGVVACLIEIYRLEFLGPQVSWSAVLVAHLATWCLTYFIVLVFFTQLLGSKSNSMILSFAFLFATLHIVFGILWIYRRMIEEPLRNSIELTWDGTYAALGILVFTYGAYVHYKTYTLTKELYGVVIGTALSLISLGFLFVFLYDFGFSSELSLFGEVLKMIGILFFVIFYSLKIDFVFRLPFKIDSVIIFNRYGMAIYAGKYREELQKDAEVPIDLITASVDAFSSFMRETTGSQKPLERVISGDRQIIVKRGELCSVAIISDNTSYFLEESMKNMVNEIESKYKDALKMDYADTKYFEGVQKVIRHSFPYLGIPKSERY